jgi:hypothetical protein
MRVVSVLCCAVKTAYRNIPNVECYDKLRDALTFNGGTPIVAHPPCRSWSAFTRHQAKPEKAEQELGLFCCDMLRKCGGVLEQPAHSHLWAAAGFPRPGTPEAGGIWSLEVWQAWWGYPMKKATWLAFSGVDATSVSLPMRLHPRGGDRRKEQSMSKAARSHTTPAFAKWLVDVARTSCVKGKE